jgi:hypothetical protein
MPLIPRDGGPTHRIEITEAIDPGSVGDWYEIRTMLGYHARMQAESSSMYMKLPASHLERLELGERLPSDDMVEVRLNAADAAHLRLSVWLKAWSHKEDITSLTIRRLPKSHAEAILKAIAAFEKIQGGPRKDGPLAGSSDASSAAPS